MTKRSFVVAILAGGPRAEQAGKVEARLLFSRSEGGTVARAGRNACALLSAHVGSIGFSEDLRPRGQPRCGCRGLSSGQSG